MSRETIDRRLVRAAMQAPYLERNEEHELAVRWKEKRDQMIKEAFQITFDEYGYIPLHQQALAWGVSNKVKLSQRADNSVLLYWATKE